MRKKNTQESEDEWWARLAKTSLAVMGTIFLVYFYIGMCSSELYFLSLLYVAGFHTEGGGPWNIPPPARFPPPQDFEIQYDVIIIIMYTMDIVQ